MNVHGIREVLVETARRLHTPRFEFAAEFLHHFLGEENEHMWFFAKFCLDYGQKIYPDRTLQLEGETDVELSDFLLFARTLIFEEIVDYFNARMGKNTALHPLIQHLNRQHHVDESRHVAFGREITRYLYRPLARRADREMIEAYLKRYMTHSIDLFYQSAVYADAGLPQPFKLRNEIRRHPGRRAHHRRFLARSLNFFVQEGVFRDDDIDA